MNLQIDAIRECFEGVIPASAATCSKDGTPNIAYLSQVNFVDNEHVALSYQFFNATRRNIMDNPCVALMVTSPVTMLQYRLRLQYLHTETTGPLFESMKAKLAGIASHVGMSGVFRLLGADVCRVLEIEQLPGEGLLAPPQKRNLLAALRTCTERLAACADLDRLLAQTLDSLREYFGVRYAMILMLDEPGKRLYTVASHGYEASGIGSEIPLGHGVIGVAARERTPIRIGHMSVEYGYTRAIRDNTRDSNLANALETEIPFPGLAMPCSQLAVPILAGPQLLGVLYVESDKDLSFSWDDEDALVSLARQLGMAIHILQSTADCGEEEPAAAVAPLAAAGAPVVVRHYRETDSVFLGDDYLIKGVAGSILWTLLHDYVHRQRTEFTNRELRLDARLRLPDVRDNLEARLILLGKRLVERNAPVRIEKTGRGRFRICVSCPVQLLDTSV